MFDSGVILLLSAGRSQQQARQLLGKWRKQAGAEAVIEAIGRARREGAVEPVTFIEGCLRFKAKGKTMANGMTTQEWLQEALL